MVLTAALVTPNLTLGGAERWLIDLVKHSDSRRLRWNAVAVSSYGGADEHLAKELAEHTKLLTNKCPNRGGDAKPFYWPAIHKITSPDFRETVAMACKDVQVVVLWGQTNMGYWFSRVSKTLPRVICSHTTLREYPLIPITGVTHLTAVSAAAMTYFDGRPGCDGLPRQVIYNGASLSRLQVREGREAIRKRWGVGPQDIVVGYLGRQSDEKNPLAPARAASRSPENYHVVYYGYGPDGADFDPKVRSWCRAHLPKRSHFYAPVPQVGDILAGFDVLVLASHREAFSLTLIEAWLAGVPVVATPVGSVPELESKYGHLTFRVPINPTPLELSIAVDKAVTPCLRDPVVKRAKDLASHEFTIGAMVNRWTDYLENL